MYWRSATSSRSSGWSVVDQAGGGRPECRWYALVGERPPSVQGCALELRTVLTKKSARRATDSGVKDVSRGRRSLWVSGISTLLLFFEVASGAHRARPSEHFRCSRLRGNASRVGTVMPQRSPTARVLDGAVVGSIRGRRRGRTPLGELGPRKTPCGETWAPDATRLGLQERCARTALAPSSSRPSRNDADGFFCASYASQLAE